MSGNNINIVKKDFEVANDIEYNGVNKINIFNFLFEL